MSDTVCKDQEQKSAEAEVEEFATDLGPFVVAAETTRMPMVFTNAKGRGHPIIFANDSFLKLTGYARDELLAQDFDFLLADSGESAQLDAAFAGKADDPEITYVRKDGSECWGRILISPVHDASGRIVQHFVSLMDTTQHKIAQSNALMLIDELHHRVKNTLATVQSIVAQAMRNAHDPEIVREAIEARIGALARSHDLLGREKWEGAGLRDVIAQALEPFSANESRAKRFTIEGDDIRLSAKATLAFGIAFNELATNALKYGALSNEAGTISIKWTIKTDKGARWLSLHWRETGGPTVEAPARKGFGSRVIEQGLAHELNGKVTLDFQPGGILCTIDVPAEQVCLDE